MNSHWTSGEATARMIQMIKYVGFKEEEWNHFCTTINWGASWLDARAITMMNEPERYSK